MKRCLECHSISPDDAITCDACGASLADVPSESMDEIERDQMVDKKQEDEQERKEFRKVKTHIIVGVIIGLTLAISVIIVGAVLIRQGSYWGVFIVLVGFAIIAGVLGTGPFTRGRGGFRPMKY